MTLSTKHLRRAVLPAAGLAALLLAGCSSGNVGESWQCPLADAGTCDSVAAADPAVPDANATWNSVLGEPLWQVRASDRHEAAPERPCEADCGGFDPFGWLARLFAADSASDAGLSHGKEAGPGERNSPLVRAAALSSNPPQEPAEPAAAPLPAEPDAAELHPITEDPHAGDLRTDEVVARIWIAPFVDADGVYREASHVRVVLEPAGWRLGR